jgi:hypothetical protein
MDMTARAKEVEGQTKTLNEAMFGTDDAVAALIAMFESFNPPPE